MGKGIIKANNGGGSYTVEIVFDRARIDAELAKLAENRQKLEDKLYTGTPAQDDLLRLQIAAIDKRVAYINEHAPENVTWPATCVDYTDDLEIDSVVGTIEIARRYNQVWKGTDEETPYLYTAGYWIRPGFTDKAAYNATRDGILNPTVNQSPASVYWNLAMMPGAMKWKPRYRRGVITSIDGNYCDLTLTDLVYLTEEKAEIDIDQTLELTGVEIDYMDCNGDAFDEGDAVIVEFTGQDWTAPKVIGFYDDPQPCGIFYYSIVFAWYGSSDLSSHWYDHLYFKLDPLGNFTWLSDEEVEALSVNTDDWFTKTYQRAFYPTPSSTSYAFPGDTYRVGNPQPSPWASFDNLYASGWNYYTPSSPNYFYLIGDLKVHLWKSTSAVGFATGKFTKTWLTSHLRSVKTETGIEHTPGRWNGFLLYYDFYRPGIYTTVISTYSLTGIELINGVLTDIRPYMDAVPGYYYTTVYHEGCVYWNSDVIYDALEQPTKPGYSPGVAPTINTVLDYLMPESAANVLSYCEKGFPQTYDVFWDAAAIAELDQTYNMDYHRYMACDGTLSEPTIRVSPRTCGGGRVNLLGYTAEGIEGYEGVIQGPWWQFPRDDNVWKNPFDSTDEVKSYPIIGENWHSTDDDKRGTNNWYNMLLTSGDNKIYQFFWSEIGGDYRFVINYKYRDASKSIVLITHKNGEYVSELTADEYQTFSSEDGDTMLFERNATRILTNNYVAAVPPHFAAGWNDFYAAKRAEYTAQGKTVDFVSSINPLLN